MNMLVRLLALLAVSAGASAVPTQVLVTIPAGANPPAGFGETLSAWKFSGQVATIHLLEQNQKDKAAFRSLAILEFPSEGSYDAWVKEGAPKLQAPATWRHADLMTHPETTPRDANRSII